jgi:hypothetical protein
MIRRFENYGTGIYLYAFASNAEIGNAPETFANGINKFALGY